MKPQEIKKAIDKDMERIQEILVSDFFTLNLDVVALNKHIAELQNQCSHEFDEDGVCKFCYTKKLL